MNLNLLAGLVAGAVLSLPAVADVVTLTFEGIPTGSAIGSYYNGSGGVVNDFGVTFGPSATALSNNNFTGEPTPTTVMVFTQGSNTFFTRASGFDTGFYLYYSSSVGGTLDIFDDVDGGGNPLASVTLPSLNLNSCTSGAPYCVWNWVGVSFSGTAKSVLFTGTASAIGFDNVTFGASEPTVPEPTSIALVGLALVGLGALRRTGLR